MKFHWRFEVEKQVDHDHKAWRLWSDSRLETDISMWIASVAIAMLRTRVPAPAIGKKSLPRQAVIASHAGWTSINGDPDVNLEDLGLLASIWSPPIDRISRLENHRCRVLGMHVLIIVGRDDTLIRW